MRIATPVLHPEFKAYSITWSLQDDHVEEFEIPHESDENDPRFRHSPLHTIFYEGAHAVRRRADCARSRDCPADPLEAGMTDFAAFRMSFLRLPVQDGAFSIATDVPGGFTRRHLEIIDDFMPSLSHLAEVFIFEETTNTLLQTYLGRTPANG
jgi:hypothetical protein